MRRFYFVTRDLHLYLGLFLSPFVLLFAASVFYLVHAEPSRIAPDMNDSPRIVSNLTVPGGAAGLQGRARVDRLRPLLDQLGIFGEVDFIRHVTNEHRLIIPVRVPGRETTVDLNYQRGIATVSSRSQPFGEVLNYLHKTPGPHNADVRGNSWFMSAWRIVADATVYLLLFITLSGIYLWLALKAERAIGAALLLAGGLSFFGLVYVIVR
jgi:hypothetical protein